MEHPKSKTLKFSADLVPLVLSGEKTSTWRLFDDKNLTIGDELSLIDHANGQIFARAKIIGVKEKKLGEITEVDFDGHDHFASREVILATFQAYYGSAVTFDTLVTMVDFKLLSRE